MTKLKNELERTKKESDELKLQYPYLGIELFYKSNNSTSRKDTFYRSIFTVDKIMKKTVAIDNIKGKSNELVLLYLLFTSIALIINANHRDAIEKYNNQKIATPPKVVSQLAYDVDRTNYQFEKDRYTKGEFLFQNYKEIESDHLLFVLMLKLLRAIKESNSIEQLLKIIQNNLQKFIEKNYPNRKITNISFSLSQKIKKDLESLDSTIKNWTQEQDVLIRQVILEIFDLKLSRSAVEDLLWHSEKVEKFDSFLPVLKEMNQEKLQINLKRLKKNERVELEDKLQALCLLDSYYTKKMKKK